MQNGQNRPGDLPSVRWTQGLPLSCASVLESHRYNPGCLCNLCPGVQPPRVLPSMVSSLPAQGLPQHLAMSLSSAVQAPHVGHKDPVHFFPVLSREDSVGDHPAVPCAQHPVPRVQSMCPAQISKAGSPQSTAGPPLCFSKELTDGLPWLRCKTRVAAES